MKTAAATRTPDCRHRSDPLAPAKPAEPRRRIPLGDRFDRPAPGGPRPRLVRVRPPVRPPPPGQGILPRGDRAPRGRRPRSLRAARQSDGVDCRAGGRIAARDSHAVRRAAGPPDRPQPRRPRRPLPDESARLRHASPVADDRRHAARRDDLRRLGGDPLRPPVPPGVPFARPPGRRLLRPDHRGVCPLQRADARRARRADGVGRRRVPQAVARRRVAVLVAARRQGRRPERRRRFRGVRGLGRAA